MSRATSGRPYRVRCPRCRRMRRASGGRYGSSRKREGWKNEEQEDGTTIKICPWCADPQWIRHLQQGDRDEKKARRKAERAAKIAPFKWGKK